MSRFSKAERLSGEPVISDLVRNGNFFAAPPLHMKYKEKIPVSGSFLRVAFSVPKRLFKKAIQRNLLKRRMREAYRKDKDELVQQLREKGKGMDIIILYSEKEIREFPAIESAMKRCLNKITKS